MGYGSRAFLAGGLGFAVAFVVACGGQNDLLSGSQASNLNAQLNSISSAIDSGQCGAAANAAQSFGNQIAALPSNVNKTLVQNLGQGAATVSQLAVRDCQSSSSSTSTSSTSTSTTTTTTTPTTSSSTTSTPTTSTSSSSSSTATNSTGSGTTSTSNGGAGIGGATGNGGTGAGGN
jgi:hypothetical protein